MYKLIRWIIIEISGRKKAMKIIEDSDFYSFILNLSKIIGSLLS